MNPFGVQLQLMIGATVPVPVPAQVVQALDSVEVTHSDRERSGFQLSFRVSHGGPQALSSGGLLGSPLFEVFNRVVIVVVFKGLPRVLVDGFITNQQHQPGEQPGASTLTLTGEDVSLMMDREDNPTGAGHRGQADHLVVLKLIARYARFGVIPEVIPPRFVDPPSPSERTSHQRGTDLDKIKALAERHAHEFYITPGPAVGSSTAYWGPPVRVGVPQKALSVNMGVHSNVENVQFQHNALAPAMVKGTVQESGSGRLAPVRAFESRRPPLASQPTWRAKGEQIRREQFAERSRDRSEAHATAQARMERSLDEVLTASGELDAMRYGEMLRPRALVGVRGAGMLYDGFFVVRRVTHLLRRGSYRQRFTLGREGLGTTTPVVRP